MVVGSSSSSALPSTPNAPAVDHKLIPQMLASAISGMLSRMPMHPVDTVKAKMQAQFGRPLYKNALEAFVKTLRNEGLRGLYSGFNIAFFGSGPASCLYFTSFEYSKHYLKESSHFVQSNPFIADFAGGLVAEACSCIAWVPIDVVKERLQVQSGLVTNPSLKYQGTLHAISSILKDEGIRGIYRGYGATLASFGPFSALFLTFYEMMKRAALPKKSETSSKKLATDLPFHKQMVFGASAGAFASFLTNPLDMAKLRMQVQRGNRVEALSFNYKNIIDGISKIVKTEGFSALFKGAGARMIFHAPSVMISMTTYEQCKIAFNL